MIDPPNAPNPIPKQIMSFPNCGTRQILNGINGFWIRDSTKMNMPINTIPRTRQKMIHQVFHLSGAFSASLFNINPILPKRWGEGTYVNPKQNNTSPEVTKNAPAQSILSRGPSRGLSFGINKNAPIATMASKIPIIHITHRHETYEVNTPPRISPNAAPMGFPALNDAKTLFFLFPGP